MTKNRRIKNPFFLSRLKMQYLQKGLLGMSMVLKYIIDWKIKQ